ncbi:TPA: hypothetical protein R1733_001172, partial [Campylobacter lari]|nr:hypothetical protein [Campylobacter lari]
MICYLHIGTPKTGTTSIQNLLVLNRKILKTKKIIYPMSLCYNNQHGGIRHFIKNYSIEKVNKDKNYLKLKAEILSNAECSFLFSDELISLHIHDFQSIMSLKKFFKDLGFQKVVCVIYLRDNPEAAISQSSQLIKCGAKHSIMRRAELTMIIHNYKILCENYKNIFGKENIIVRLFDKNEFYQGDLLKDFIHSVGLEWDDKFIIPPKQNETLDLIGFELQKRLNKLGCGFDNYSYSTKLFSDKYFSSKELSLKFQPPKEIIQSYIDCFEESNEWVRKEFFPHKERLFPKKDLSNYKENYELKEMKPEYWDRIAEFIADIIKTKTQPVTNQNSTCNKPNSQAQSKLSFQTKYGTAKS